MLSVFMAGFAFTPLFYGALSDRVGRKPALYLGLGLFTAAGLLCTFAPTMGWLLAGRFFQGSGAGAGTSLAFAIVRDMFTGDKFNGPKLGSRLSILAMVVNTAPMIAPSLGALLLGVTGWRGIYGVLATLGALTWGLVWLFLPETRPSHPARTEPSLKSAIQTLWRHPNALAHVAVYGISFSSVFAYIASSSLLLIGFFHISRYQFALLFALTAAGIVAGAFTSGRLATRVAGRHLIATGLACCLAGPAIIAITFFTHHASLPITMMALVLATFGNGLVNPAATRTALTHSPQIAGLIGALLTTGQMSFCALSSFVAALLVNRWGVQSIPLVMLGFAALAAAVYKFGTKSEV
jgi:DHA1 family bicyclomycin/chloramphenicol resistance-like MFS transporter